ncbi:uncharacterized protein LOC144907614 [Branchiostoma floridae x Branchiostoma belcheri]
MVDINECDSANGGCSQDCNNTIGSFQCFCSTGYMLDVDGFACDDINECGAANGDCGQFCNNTEGSFSCYCATGYSLGVDRLTCDGFDPVSHLSCSTITTTSISITWIKPAADITGYSIIYAPTQETDPPVRLFADGIHHNSLALFWTPPVARLTGYELTYGNTERHRKRRSTTSVTLPGNSDNYLVQDLVPATQYTFSLTAARIHH